MIQGPMMVRVCLVILWTLLLAPEAWAAPPRVELVHSGSEEHQSSTKSAVEEGLRGLDVRLVEVSQAPTVAEVMRGEVVETTALARVRVDLLPGQLQLVVTDSAGTGSYLRSIPYDPDRKLLAYEQVAQILGSTIKAMMERTAIEQETTVPLDVPQPAPPDPKPTPTAVRLGFDAGAAGTILIHSPELGPIPGAELQAAGRWGSGRHQGVVRISGGFAGTEHRSPEVSLRMRRIPVSALTGFRAVWQRWRLETLVGAGVTFDRYAPHNAAPDLVVEEVSWLVAGAPRLALRLERQLSQHWNLFASARADFHSVRRRIVVVDDGEAVPLITPFAVQPSLAVGFSWNP